MVLAHRRARALAVVVLAATAGGGCGTAAHDDARGEIAPRAAVTRRLCAVRTGRTDRLPGRTRVLFMGDSIMGNVLVDGRGQALFERHGFEVRRSATPGFGLLDDPQHAYSNQMALQVAGFDPDIIVLEFIGNYRSFGDPGLPGVDIDTPAFYAAWKAEAESVTRHAVARGAGVFWVLGPTVGISQEWFDRVHVIAGDYRDLSAASCGGDVDAFEVLGDPWVAGPWRTPDGVHLTAAGGAVLAEAICVRVVERVRRDPGLRASVGDAAGRC